MGGKEFAQYKQLLDIKTQGEKAVEQLVIKMNKAKSADDKATYAQEIEDHKKFTDQRVQQTKQGFEDEAAAQANWLNGAKKAIADFMDAQKNQAGQMEGLTTKLIGGFGDAFAAFVSGTKSAKDAFGSLMDSMYQDALKFVAN
jgi:lambda family phage tail tape measure protein